MADDIRTLKRRLDEAMKVDESIIGVVAGIGGVVALCSMVLKAVASGEELRAKALQYGPILKILFTQWQERMNDGKAGYAAWNEVILWRDPKEIEAAKAAGKDWRTVVPVYEKLPPEMRAAVMSVIDDGLKRGKKETHKDYVARAGKTVQARAKKSDFVKRSMTATVKRQPTEHDLAKERIRRHDQMQYQE